MESGHRHPNLRIEQTIVDDINNTMANPKENPEKPNGQPIEHSHTGTESPETAQTNTPLARLIRLLTQPWTPYT